MSLSQSDLQQIENLCFDIIGGNDDNARRIADEKLSIFKKKESILQLEEILKVSRNNYALFFAGDTVIKLVKANWNTYNKKQKSQIKNFILEVLGKRCKDPSFVEAQGVVTKLIEAVGSMCKQGWLEDQENRDLPQQVRRFFLHTENPHLASMGLSVLMGISREMNKFEPTFNLRTHRKISSSFRDLALRGIFESAIFCLKDVKIDPSNTQSLQNYKNPQIGLHDMAWKALDLLISCLKFDFVGIYPEESVDENLTTPIPDSWRPLFEESDTVDVIWSKLFQLPDQKAQNRILEVLIYLSCVRRQLFTDDNERCNYLNKFLFGCCKVLFNAHNTNQDILSYQPIFHDFCRLLSRLKNNFLLSDFVPCEHYPRFINSVASFSVSVFKNWRFSQNSCYYILDLWKLLLKSTSVSGLEFLLRDKLSFIGNARHLRHGVKETRMSDVMLNDLGESPFILEDKDKEIKNNKPQIDLDAYAPEIATQFVASRLELARAISQDVDMDNPLETPDLSHQLDVLPHLIHCKYAQITKTLIGFFNNIYKNYKEAVNTMNGNNFNQQMNIKLIELEGQLAWLIYIFSSIIGHRFFEPQEKLQSQEIDAHLTVRVFQMFQVVGQRLSFQANNPSQPLVRLELAVLHFLSHFRARYMIDEHSNEKLFEVINLQIGSVNFNLNGHGMQMGNNLGKDGPQPGSEMRSILNVFMDKIWRNLKFFGMSKMVVEETLKLFEHLSTTFKTSKTVSSLDMTKMLLENHSAEQFGFLMVQQNLPLRTRFYSILARTLFMSNEITESEFLRFIHPMEDVCQKLMTISNLSDVSENAIFVLKGFFRDVTGVCSACLQRNHYQYFFNWFYPKHFALLQMAFSKFSLNSNLIYSPLKFLREFVCNKNKRIEFGYSSPKGILLFKETAKLLVTFGSNIEKKTTNVQTAYNEKYKGIKFMFEILQNSLCGKYCNFGVFSLYKDSCLMESVLCALNLALSIPKNELLQYPKIKVAYYNLIETLFKNFLDLVIEFDTQMFIKLLSSVGDELNSTDSSLSSKACSALDNLCVFLFNGREKQTREIVRLKGHLKGGINFFHSTLNKLFHLMIFEDCSNQWSVSRVILAIMCVDPEHFKEIQRTITNSFSDIEKQKKMNENWNLLMKDVNFNLEPKNRDLFTSNIINFVQNVKKLAC